MTSDDTPVLVTRAAYQADAAAWASRRRDPGFLPGRYERFRALLTAGARVLDLGCGPGADAAILADLGLEVTGLDLTRSMLEVARGSGRPRGLVEGDSRRLPFRDGAFDGVWASASLLHLPKDQVDFALREARRVLKTDGLLCTFMKMGKYDGIMTQSERGGGALVRGDRYFAHYDPAEWLTHLRSCGFEPAEHQTSDVQARLPNTPWLTTYARALGSRGEAARLQASVQGRVQGVGFRFFVERVAGEAGLSGWVRNLADGSTVEVLAEGPPSELDDLLSQLHRGPRFAAVESIQAVFAAASGGLEGFAVSR